MRTLHLLSLMAFLAASGHAQADTILRNWFDDPHFQVSSDVRDCPVPLGPLMTEAQRRAQAHHRAEKGTTCWLAGQCDRANAYAYDRDISEAFKVEAAARSALFKRTSIWITVQARVVFMEGCSSKPSAASELEAFARQLPHVQQAIAVVRTSSTQVVPYRVRTQQ